MNDQLARWHDRDSLGLGNKSSRLSPMSLIQRQIAIVEEFAPLTNWEDRYKKIIAIGRELPDLDESLKTDDAKVRGCASSVWLHASLEGDRVRYQADSDAVIVRGLVALLMRVYDDASPADILATEPMFIEELELAQHLTSNRANGLAAMVKQLKLYALGFSQ